MTVYFLTIFLLMIVGGILKPTKSAQKKKLFLIFAFVILTVVSGCRAYTVGADTPTYVNLFLLVDRIDIWNGRFEAGFISYLKILAFFSDNPGMLLFVSSAICVGCVCLFIYHHSKDPVLSLLLYILLRTYFVQMNSMRQALATAITLIAFMMLFKNKKIVSAFLILLAASMHTIVIVAFIPYIIWCFFQEAVVNKLTTKTCLKFSVMLSLVAFIGYELIVKIVSMLLPQYRAYFTSAWSDANYFASVLNLLIQVVFLLIGIIYFGKRTLETEEKFAGIMLICSIVFSTLAIRMEIWSRISDVFSIYTALLWTPALVRSIRDGRERFIIRNLIIFCSMAYLFVIFYFRPEWDRVVPYMFR